MSEPVQSFRLAKMSRSIWILTAIFLPVPLLLAGTALVRGGPLGLLGVAAFVAAVYALVWLWFRPTRFELAPGALRIVWPIRRREIELASVEGLELIDAKDLRSEFGLLLRVGAGGLWGGFGMLWSSRGRHLDFYVSRLSPLVLIRRRLGRSLLITPEEPERFAAELRARVRA